MSKPGRPKNSIIKEKRKDLTGKKFGRWTVIGPAPDVEHGKNRPDPIIRVTCKCDCGTIKTVRKQNLTKSNGTKSCGCFRADSSRARSGSLSPTWKGGRMKTSQGYIKQVQKDHPRCDKDGYILEHTLVMEKNLGRYLLSKETVHHINGIRDDNRPENLELWASSHPPGQRISDLVKWAKEILETYET